MTRKPKNKSGGLDDSDKSSDLGGQGSDNDMKEVDLNPVSESAGILKAESITEEGKTVEKAPEEEKEKKEEKAAE